MLSAEAGEIHFRNVRLQTNQAGQWVQRPSDKKVAVTPCCLYASFHQTYGPSSFKTNLFCTHESWTTLTLFKGDILAQRATEYFTKYSDRGWTDFFVMLQNIHNWLKQIWNCHKNRLAPFSWNQICLSTPLRNSTQWCNNGECNRRTCATVGPV